jgi:hypothetical protein
MAGQPDLINTLENYDALRFINLAIAWVILFAGALCLIYVFLGALSFIFSGGKEDKVKDAINTIRYAIIGLVLVFISVFIVGTAGKALLGLDVIRYISYSEIIKIVQSISTPSDNTVDTLE